MYVVADGTINDQVLNGRTENESGAIDSKQQIVVEVVYALPDRQTLLEVSVDAGVSVQDVIDASGIMEQFEGIDLKTNRVGIWNRTCKLRDVPKNGDRIEIYRPLIADPKEARRVRAEKAKVEGRANRITGGRPKANSSENIADTDANANSNVDKG